MIDPVTFITLTCPLIGIQYGPKFDFQNIVINAEKVTKFQMESSYDYGPPGGPTYLKRGIKIYIGNENITINTEPYANTDIKLSKKVEIWLQAVFKNFQTQMERCLKSN